MPIIEEIKAKFSGKHDDLTKSYYGGESGLTKDEFDTQHAKIWSDMDAEIKTASDYIKPIPTRDLATEIDDLNARVEKLEKK